MILIDFGCALEVEEDTVYKDIVGTPYYLAPESASKVTKRTGVTLKKSDVWSVGVIAYILLTGRPPFNGDSTAAIFHSTLTRPLRFPTDIRLSKEFKDFARRALRKPAKKRLSVDEALKHPWVQGEGASDQQISKDVLKCLKQFNYQSKLKKQVSKLLATNMGVQPRRKIFEHFEKLDKDKNGRLDLHEVKKLVMELAGGEGKKSEEEAETEAKEIMKVADIDGGGYLDFDEFATIWQRKL
eukprot:UN30117